MISTEKPNMLSLDDYISKAHHLVPAPQILPQLLPLLNQPDIDSARVVELISYNQSLTASVLRICNSAYYSRGTSIDNLRDAVTRVGFRQVYDIVVCIISSVALARPQKGYGVEANALWDHSVTSALAGQVIAQEAQVDQQVVFTGALLHDIGKIVLSNALEEMEEQVIYESKKTELSPVELEIKLLGVNHAEVGGRLLEHWKLPGNLVSAVRFHHRPEGANGQSHVASCVYLGNFVAYFMGHGYGHHSLDLRGRDPALKILGLSSERLPHYMNETSEKLKRVKHLYNLK